MTAAPADATRRGMWLWDALFVLVTIGTSVLVSLDDTSPARRVASVVLVVACLLGWLFHARRLVMEREPGTGPARVLAGCLVLALVVSTALAPSANWAAFMVLSQMYWLLRLRVAIVVTVVLTLALPVVGGLFRGTDPVGVIGESAPQSLFLAVFGVLVGVYVHRVSVQSSERAELIAELERSQAEAAALSHRAGVAAERERMAGEIHDTLAQGFTSIVTLLQAAQAEFDTDAQAARRHVALAVASAKENLREARALVAASAPVALGTSLAEAVGRQVERFAEVTGVDAEHGTSGTPRRLPPDREVVLLRAAQELLANTARHAAAATVTVRLDFGPADAVTLTVADDGVGFDPDRVGGQSYGLAMMRARVERIGGRLDLDTGPSAGTVVTVVVPTPSGGAS